MCAGGHSKRRGEGIKRVKRLDLRNKKEEGSTERIENGKDERKGNGSFETRAHPTMRGED